MTSRIDIIASNGNDGLHYESIADETALDSRNSTENGFREGKAVHEDHYPDTSNMIEQSEQLTKPPEPKLRFTPEGFAMADHSEQHLDMIKRYPKYYKDVSSLSAIDVYAVHELFGIDDSSGCIQHASKKLLLCGVRTGGKDVATEIKEARDTLTRKLQLMGVE